MAREARDGRSIGCASAASRAKMTCATTDFSTDNFATGEPLGNFIDKDIEYDLSAPNPLVAAKACLLQAAFVDINIRKSRSVYY